MPTNTGIFIIALTISLVSAITNYVCCRHDVTTYENVALDQPAANRSGSFALFSGIMSIFLIIALCAVLFGWIPSLPVPWFK